jgi:hypothetical protein
VQDKNKTNKVLFNNSAFPVRKKTEKNKFVIVQFGVRLLFNIKFFFSLDPERSDDSCRVLRCRLPSVPGDDDDSWTLDRRQLVLQKDDSWY